MRRSPPEALPVTPGPAASAAAGRRRFALELGGWIGLTVLLLAVVSLVVQRSLDRLVAESSELTQSYRVVSLLEGVSSELKDAETGERGYVITGDANFLEPYFQAQRQVQDSLALLERQLAGDEGQARRLGLLREAAAAKLTRSAEVIEERRLRGHEAAYRLVASGDGKRLMDRVRSLIREMVEVEEARLQERAGSTQGAKALAQLSAQGALAASLVILLLIFYLVVREARRRARAEAVLEQANLRQQESLARLQELNRDITVIGAMGEMLQSCRGLGEAHAVVGRFLGQLFPDCSGAVGVINASRNLVDIVARWGPAPPATAGFAPDECWGMRRGRPHLETSAGGSCRHSPVEAGRAELCQPMVAQGETVGVLCISGPAERLDERVQRLAQTASEHVSLALANLKLQESLRIQSIRDPLTGLFNRRYMESSLERELARAARHGHALSLLMCDLDHFKRFNDTHGHAAGDALLAEFGRLLKGQVRGEDIACRYGGEEFLLILPEAPAEAALRRAEAIRLAVHQLVVRHRDQALGQVTVSIGLASFPGQADSGPELMRLADLALYRAKQSGRDRVVVAEV